MTSVSQIDYDEMEAIIKELEAEQEEIMTLLDETKSKIENLHASGWTGNTADQFFSEMEKKILPSTAKTVYALDVAGHIAKQIISIIHQADQETASFFAEL